MLFNRVLRIGIIGIALFNGAAFASVAQTQVVRHEKRNISPADHAWTRKSVAPQDAVIPLRIALASPVEHLGHEKLMDVSHPSSPNFGKHWFVPDLSRSRPNASMLIVRTIGRHVRLPISLRPARLPSARCRIGSLRRDSHGLARESGLAVVLSLSMRRSARRNRFSIPSTMSGDMMKMMMTIKRCRQASLAMSTMFPNPCSNTSRSSAPR